VLMPDETQGTALQASKAAGESWETDGSAFSPYDVGLERYIIWGVEP